MKEWNVSGSPESILHRSWQTVCAARTLVVKIGSNLLTTPGNGLNGEWIAARAMEMAQLIREGRRVVIVTSGAVAAGYPRLGLTTRPRLLREKQAAAAAGQAILMGCYETVFSAHGIHTAQILLTRDDVEHRRRYLNARDTLKTLLDFGLVPIVNENDTVMVEQIKFGDNDTLSANVADLVGADLLILLSDVDGLFDADPRHNPMARPIPLVAEVTPEVEQLAGGSGSAVGLGGMVTKLKAAKMASLSGCPMVLTNGFSNQPILSVFSGQPVGTLFLPTTSPLNAHKRWLANSRLARGELTLDAGAVAALHKGKSLLARGIVAVEGDFDRGDAVFCLDPEGVRIAKGQVNYPTTDLKKIAGHHSNDFEAILGFLGDPEVIHRDRMAIITTP
ncbi:MAG: glutamate 5-kinase [Magnetococcales bacterium]|nr:glutamate 5-kinase [Magnetococcales bacterium]MBF0151839.1 glutamate 5-kinase [Magnetococcales bacterium]MBF0172009.1 glutamate 5-kinase [Magnetococcales bacterium]MBF0346610.1 glutamate 5-kinase [Magnetococcales bacterium]MBF0630591.1 glutamate 5-kinase [Magnetococcales bacterium]